MSGGATFVRLYPSDWRSGCIGLTLEQEGLYCRICAHYYETGVRLPLDDTEAAHRLGLNPKNYRRVRDELLNQGKIKRYEDGYANDRAERELIKAKAGAKADVGSARNGPDSERENGGGQVPGRGNAREGAKRQIDDQSAVDLGLIPDQSPIIGQNSEQNQRAFLELRAKSQKKEESAAQQTTAARESAALRLDLRALAERLFEAAGPALASQAIAPGLAAMTVPAMWLDQGCDLELDILETLRAQALKRRGVMSWDYFTKAVAEAKARREAGLPHVGRPMQSGAAPAASRYVLPPNDPTPEELAAAREESRATIREARIRNGVFKCDPSAASSQSSTSKSATMAVAGNTRDARNARINARLPENVGSV